MKKSEALNILGLTEGATDEQVKKAHRVLVIAHHPDKFSFNSVEHDKAEEQTKRLNEARDVLLNQAWTPEFDPRRDGIPYAASSAGTGSGNSAANPFTGWPYAQGQASWVWTSSEGSSGAASAGQPFGPFSPFGATPRQKTAQEILTETARKLKSEVLVVVLKAAVLTASILLDSMATGLFFYVILSIVYGLWKRIGSCLIAFIIPIALLISPVIFFLSPKGGAVTIALGIAFAVSLLFDLANVRDRLRLYLAARKASSKREA